MRLFCTVFLAVGSAVFIAKLSPMPIITMPDTVRIVALPPWFFALVISGALFFGLRFAKYEEDMALMPFAAAGALFSVVNGVTIGVGVLMAVFALIGFANAKSDGTIPSFRALPAWLFAAVVCAGAPWAILRLFVIGAGSLGVIIFLTGALLFQRYLKKFDKNKK